MTNKMGLYCNIVLYVNIQTLVAQAVNLIMKISNKQVRYFIVIAKEV